jgi:hypothetical protein
MSAFPGFAMLAWAVASAPAAAPAPAPTPEQVLAALPPFDASRLSHYQSQLFNATQFRLQLANPNRFLDIDQVVFKYNMCFREVALQTVPRRFVAMLSILTPGERQEVLDHLALPGAGRKFLYEEGISGRLELPYAWFAALDQTTPGVKRFYWLLQSRMRTSDRTNIGITDIACHREMKAELDRMGLVMPPATPAARKR